MDPKKELKRKLFKLNPQLAQYEQALETQDRLDKHRILVDGLEKLKGDKGDTGNDGYTPVKGKDYFTNQEVDNIVNRAKPIKGRDYFTDDEAQELIRLATPVKGIDYKDGEQGERGEPGIPGKPGEDGQDSIETPESIAEKLNTLKEVLDPKVLKGGIKALSKQINYNDIQGKPNMNDLRWHGSGISKVATDATLTGDGTDANPLHAVGNGTGDVHGPASSVADNIATYSGLTGKIIKDGGSKISDLVPRTQNALTKEPTGFSVAPTIDYDPTTQKVTLTGAFVAYYQGVDVSIANPTFVNGWVSAAHTNTTAHNYFLSFDGTNFTWTTDAFPGFDKVLIASIYYGATNKYALRECHGFMSWQDHKELHETIGTYKESGGTIPSASYALSSTTAADRRPNIDQTLIADEDLTTTLPALTSETYTQYNLTGASVGAYTLTAADIVPLLANNPYYNTFSTPNWGQTLMPANSAATVWIYALPVTSSANSQAYRYLFVQPQWITQATSSSAGALTTAVNTEALRLPSELNLGTLTVQSPELVCIGKIIIDYTSSNWRLREVTLLTGNKYSQIGSPSGNYLSTVATDTSLTGDGTGASPLKVSISQVVLASQVFN